MDESDEAHRNLVSSHGFSQAGIIVRPAPDAGRSVGDVQITCGEQILMFAPAPDESFTLVASVARAWVLATTGTAAAAAASYFGKSVLRIKGRFIAASAGWRSAATYRR